MPAALDFRTLPFHATRVSDSGRYIGNSIYWKLYAIENLVRVIVHSVLTAQIALDWWSVAVDPKLQGTVLRIRRDYSRAPWHTSPGTHDIYYVFLKDLNLIIQANIHLFRPLIPDIDRWVGLLEQLRLPRNVVGHVNWLNATDKSQIDTTYVEAKALIRRFSRAGNSIIIP
jgi:hypothetical protein